MFRATSPEYPRRRSRLRRVTSSLARGLVAAALTGCGPATLWYGRDVGRTHGAKVLDHGECQTVQVDGKVVGRHRAVGFAAFRFSPSGERAAYPALDPDGWRVVLDGVKGPPWDGIADLRWSSDGTRIAYAAVRRNRWYVVIDGRPWGPWESLLTGSFALAPDGRTGTFAATRGGRMFVVSGRDTRGPFDGVAGVSLTKDGEAAFRVRTGGSSFVQIGGRKGELFDDVPTLVVSHETGEVAYVGRRGGAYSVVHGDGVEGPYEAVRQLSLGPVPGQWVYAAQRGKQWSVVQSGRAESVHEEILPETLAFSPRGRHLAYAARDGAVVRVFVDGRPGPAFQSVEPVSFDASDTRWGYVGHGHKGSVVLLEHRPVHREKWAAAVTFAPRGSRYVYVADRGGTAAVVAGGRSFPFSLVVADALVFDAAGRHWAALVGDEKEKRLFVTIDGYAERPFDLEEFVASRMQREPGEAEKGAFQRAVREWVRAELDLFVRGEKRASPVTAPRPRPAAR